MSIVEIRRVADSGDLTAFIDLPYRLHAGTPWVPPLKLERRLFLSRRLNAFFTHGEARYFLARRGDRVVGRITAQIDGAFNAYHGNRWGWFGFLEFEDDPEIPPELLRAATDWLSARGCDRMVGPVDFSMNDEAGVLIDGFDRAPMIRQAWQPPYYQRRCEEAGLTKAMDLLMWSTWTTEREQMNPVLFELADKVRTEHGITIRNMSRRHLRQEMDRFADVYNAAWASNWDFVPFSKEDLDAYTQEMHLVFEREWFMIAETAQGDTVGAVITVPDINRVLEKMNGRVLPFGWWYFMNKRRIIDQVRVGFLGVKPEYQHTGIAAALYVEQIKTAERSHRSGAEMGWILETNEAMNRAMEAMSGKVVKRYRVYERELAGAQNGADG